MRVVRISVDNYYRKDPAPDTNWDDPQSVELDLLRKHLLALIIGESIEVPTYCFSPPNRLDETIKITPTDGMVLIVEGIFALHDELSSFVDMIKIYVDTPLDIAAIWRLLRDEKENRGRTLEQGVDVYLTKVRPMFFKHVAPTKGFADLSIRDSNQESVDKVIELVSLQRNPPWCRAFSGDTLLGQSLKWTLIALSLLYVTSGIAAIPLVVAPVTGGVLAMLWHGVVKPILSWCAKQYYSHDAMDEFESAREDTPESTRRLMTHFGVRAPARNSSTEGLAPYQGSSPLQTIRKTEKKDLHHNEERNSCFGFY